MELEKAEANVHVDEKKRSFYENLFTKEEGDAPTKVKKPRAKKVKQLAEGEKADENTETKSVEELTGKADGKVKKGKKSTDDGAVTTDKTSEAAGEKTERAPKVGKNAQSGYKQKLENLKKQKETEVSEREKAKKQFEKKLRVKSRYSKQLTRRNKNGQMVMSGMIGHLLQKIVKD